MVLLPGLFAARAWILMRCAHHDDDEHGRSCEPPWPRRNVTLPAIIGAVLPAIPGTLVTGQEVSDG
ncbi:MAG TPA: hypothetical protein PKJ99_17415 [Thermoanaerobaculales bacterium]|nr:hypothetical protein [Thermoanaerobaculales bacterium]HPA80521.1 hypothetical protein [Thermoanaerobaculales bacterium]HQL29544.1 hypothetical protein [Thermoanaerobaculales bacterium]HQN95946.1 hypothetical protein [Thermoanaerobaculales bacterium]